MESKEIIKCCGLEMILESTNLPTRCDHDYCYSNCNRNSSNNVTTYNYKCKICNNTKTIYKSFDDFKDYKKRSN